MTDLRTITTGFSFGESARWHEGRLWFSDWMAGEIIAVDDGGKTEVVANVDAGGGPFCFDFRPDGQALVMAGGYGRLLRREPDGSLVPHADLSHLSSYPWNEVTVDAYGGAFVNNIGFDFPDGEVRPGFVAYVTPDGDAVRVVAEEVEFPNGMALTPDGRTLIVAESYAGRLTAFDVGADGSLSRRRTWAAIEGAAPDGICLDAEGAVWFADVPHTNCVRVREGGDVLATVDLDRGGFSCALGDRTLYIVAQDFAAFGGGEPTGRVYAVEAPAPAA
jgi:sugar lactone lactonase YvrE